MPIETLQQLKDSLQVALEIEHATIPPYLCAMYSILPDTNSDSYYSIRSVVVEEMLHLTLAANLLNAIGGTPVIDHAGFIPDYPTVLPGGETDFIVHLEMFSPSAIETFLKIERPFFEHLPRANLSGKIITAKDTIKARIDALQHGEPKYRTIGEFYQAILNGFDKLYLQLGAKLFSGDGSRQVTSEYYYSSGGGIIEVSAMDDARKAIHEIMDQGEGLPYKILTGDINPEGEAQIAHYFRFMQIKNRRYYITGDSADNPTGAEFPVDFQQVYPMATDLHHKDFPESSQMQQYSVDFNKKYTGFLQMIHKSFNGQPYLIKESIGKMFTLRDLALGLIRNPCPGKQGMNGGPTFEYIVN